MHKYRQTDVDTSTNKSPIVLIHSSNSNNRYQRVRTWIICSLNSETLELSKNKLMTDSGEAFMTPRKQSECALLVF